jgi:HAD superfamily hydrolase (TIGR01509 family)
LASARASALSTTSASLIFLSLFSPSLPPPGVIILSEDLHRDAYNAAFAHFNLKINGAPVVWSDEAYDMLQNTVGGGKPKMRWWFAREGWPTNTAVPGQETSAPVDEDARTALIDTLQEWKTAEFERLIASGEVSPRPGVLRLMDEAKAAGLKVGVCSAATKSACVATVTAMLGPARLAGLDIFLAGDDVSSKKPDPEIYRTAAERLGVDPAGCVVVEDSSIGLAAALGAGMRCIITYHKSTVGEAFEGAERVVGSLGGGPGGGPPEVTAEELIAGRIVQDDRVTIG